MIIFSWTREHLDMLVLLMDSRVRVVRVQRREGRRGGVRGGNRLHCGWSGVCRVWNLEDWAAKTGKRVTYGGTEIVDPGSFLVF